MRLTVGSEEHRGQFLTHQPVILGCFFLFSHMQSTLGTSISPTPTHGPSEIGIPILQLFHPTVLFSVVGKTAPTLTDNVHIVTGKFRAYSKGKHNKGQQKSKL